MGDEYEYDDGMDEQPRAVVPHDLKDLRSCLRCYLIKTAAQFAAHGCDNCPFLHLDEDRDRLWSCTTSNFEGVVSMIDPSDSWVARWQGIAEMVPGCYAIVANGELPIDVREELDSHEPRIPYRKAQRGRIDESHMDRYDI